MITPKPLKSCCKKFVLIANGNPGGVLINDVENVGFETFSCILIVVGRR
jgi:hypothetical protein